MNKKITHLEYHTVSIECREDDNFFIEIHSTTKKPKNWENTKVCVFDSWYDDLIHETSFNSDYLWISIKSVHGIGAITFLPDGFDEKNKDYAIIHEYVDKKTFNPVIAVCVYPNTQERIDFVKKHLISLKNTNIPVFLCSNMGCPDELINLCDGFIYTGPNEICTVPEDIENKKEYLKHTIKYPIVLYPQNIKLYLENSFTNGGTYLWSTVKCLKHSINFLEKKGYTHIMISEGEFILDDQDYEKPLNILKDMFENDIALDFYYTQGSYYLQCYLWFGDIKHLNKSFENISKKDKHYPKNNKNSNANALILCEKYLQNKLFSYNNTDKIRIRTLDTNVDILKKKYWYTNRTEVIPYTVESFKSQIYGTNEVLSFPIYFPNTNEISLSICSKNNDSDTLNFKSFIIEPSEDDYGNAIIVCKNNTSIKNLDFKIKLLDKSSNLISERVFKECVLDTWYIYYSFIPITNIQTCQYEVSRSSNNDDVFIGKFNVNYL
jgi:hypothetical protein